MIKDGKVYCEKCNKYLGVLEDGFLDSEIGVMVHLLGEDANTAECPECGTKTSFIEE